MTDNPIPSFADSEEERVRLAEERLSRCTNHKGSSDEEWIPVWSSDWLDRIVQIVLGVPGSKPTDIFRGLWNLLAHTQAPLTEVMTEFQRAITIATRVRYRTLWTDADFSWVMTALKKEGATPAQAYMSIFIFNDEQLLACKKEIVAALENSEFLHRVLHTGSMMSPDVLPYGHYQIESIEAQSTVVDGVFYDYWVGAVLGIVISEVLDNQERRRVSPLKGRIPAPSHWQGLIQKRLGDDKN